jgi:hypothetical protein
LRDLKILSSSRFKLGHYPAPTDQLPIEDILAVEHYVIPLWENVILYGQYVLNPDDIR